MLKDSIEQITLQQFSEKQRIKFGTSGVRGLNSALTDKVCYVYIIAFLQYLSAENLIKPGQTIQVAGDLRANTETILRVVQKAILDQGFKVNDCGKVSTPVLAYYCFMQKQAGIMVTGSHIPENMNGMKFYKPTGEILKLDEQAILNQAIQLPRKLFDDNGAIQQRLVPVSKINQTASKMYCERYLAFFPSLALANMRIGVYAHSSVAIPLLVTILQAFGAEVIQFGDTQKFHSIDTEALTQYDMDIAEKYLKQEKLDVIVSADGDGDRPLMTDEYGHWLHGDILGMLTAIILKANYVVVPVTCNSSIDYLPQFKQIIRSQVGSPFVIEKMDALLKEGCTRILGYEANGGVLLGSDFGTLQALPTRDSVLPMLCLLYYVNQQKIKISDLVKKYCCMYTVSNSIKEIELHKTQELLQIFSNALTILQDFFKGSTAIKKIEKLDGLRIYFNNDEVIHLRPSGNAPELRIYTEALSIERATELNDNCIKLLKERGIH